MAGRSAGRPRTPVNRGDIYQIPPCPALGREQSGGRPVLLVSSSAFNRATRVPITLPIARGGAFARKIGFAVQLSGLRTTGIVRCDQPRALDLEARGGRMTEQIGEALLEEVMAKVVTLFE